jgi:predicted transcriptional regulator
MSIKPKYGLEILRGRKKVELRGFVGEIAPGDIVVLYLSSPVQAISGEFRAGRIVFGVDEIKRFVEALEDPGVDEEDWGYLVGRRKPMAIEVLEPVEYEVKVTLRVLREEVPGFRPPMSYRLVKPVEPLYGVIERTRRMVLKRLEI